MHGNARLFPGLVAFIRFEVLITKYLNFGPENSLVFSCLAVMVTRMCVNHWIVDGWDHISLPLDQRAIVELTPLEEDQLSISIYFDHVLDLIQPGMMHFLNIFL